MSNPVTRLLTLSVDDMAKKLVNEFGGTIEDAKTIALSMISSDSPDSIGIKQTERFWEIFVLLESFYEFPSTRAGYTISELADLLRQDYWCGEVWSRSAFDSVLENLPKGSIRVRLSEDETYFRKAFVVGINNFEGVEFWKYFQDSNGFIKVKEIPNKSAFPEERKYRTLQDLIRDCKNAFQSLKEKKNIESESKLTDSTLTIPIPMDSISPNDCIVCMDNTRDTLLLPCSHLHFCVRCAEKLERCPLCKVIITERKTVFL